MLQEEGGYMYLSFFRCISISGIIFTLFFSFPAEAAGKKSLYVHSIIAHTGVYERVSQKVRDYLVLSLLEGYSNKYQLVTDDDIKVMFKQAALLMTVKCDAESCAMKIADAIDADEIIYGSVSRENNKLVIKLTNLERDSKTLTQKKKSFVMVALLESQLEWFCRECAKKLMNNSYSIDLSRAPGDVSTELVIDNNEINKVHRADIQNMSIAEMNRSMEIYRNQADNETIIRVLDYLGELIKEGDILYKDNDFIEARDRYQSVLIKINESLREENKIKINTFITQVHERISATYKAEVVAMIKKADNWINSHDKINEKIIESSINQYFSIKAILRKIPEEYQNDTAYIDNTLIQRLARLYSLKSGIHESSAEDRYREYRFLSALSDYDNALSQLEESGIKHKIIDDYRSRITTKRTITYETGKAWLLNRVTSLCNQAEYLNIRGNNMNAKKILKNTKYILGYNKMLITDQAEDIYKKTCSTLRYSYKASDIDYYNKELNSQYYGACALIFDSICLLTLGCGITFHVLYNDAYSEYNSLHDKYSMAANIILATRLHNEVRKKKDEADTYSILTIVFYSVSAAAVIPAIYFTYKYLFYKILKKKMANGSISFNILYKNGSNEAITRLRYSNDRLMGAYITYRF